MRSEYDAVLGTIQSLLPQCDWDHWHRSRSAPDPETDAIILAILATVAALLASTALMLFIGGPLILAWTRKARHLFWSIPAVNVLVYLAAIALRPYPGGLRAQFGFPGILYVVIELIVLVLLSVGAAILLTFLYLIVHAIRTKLSGATASARGVPGQPHQR